MILNDNQAIFLALMIALGAMAISTLAVKTIRDIMKIKCTHSFSPENSYQKYTDGEHKNEVKFTGSFCECDICNEHIEVHPKLLIPMK